MLGVAMFSTMDAVAKGLLQSYPTAQVVWARFIGQALLVLVILGPKRIGPTLRTPYPWLHLARSSFQLATTGLFFLSLGYIGLAEATALADMSPLLITLGAALFLGEKLGPRRMAGVAVAMIGALIIIRPGAGLFTPAALLPLACAVCYAASALLTRLVGQKEGPATSMLHAALFGAVATSIAVHFRLAADPARRSAAVCRAWLPWHRRAILPDPGVLDGRSIGDCTVFLPWHPLCHGVRHRALWRVSRCLDDHRRACDRGIRALCLAPRNHQAVTMSKPAFPASRLRAKPCGARPDWR